ncbi:hypothetical protein [Terribacillus halophilus]|uniref:hypothetical protein n=1 Tax=Terribacillus halophilus TaxID=361279 RepID=UPI000B881CFE|nr:hypothetical protein [Terribacillus halophilus]
MDSQGKAGCKWFYRKKNLDVKFPLYKKPDFSNSLREGIFPGFTFVSTLLNLLMYESLLEQDLKRLLISSSPE